MLIEGSCHCRNIQFLLTWYPDPTSIPARACSCSFCVRHGGVWTSHPTASLKITVDDAARVSRYSFGTRTAEFLVCSTCGVVPLVTSRIDDHVYAVVNVNAFEGVDPKLLQHAPVSFEKETETTRLARRARGWIADVEFVAEFS